VVPARVRKPRDKAKVEAAVQNVERWIIARLRHQKFFSLFELNTAIRILLRAAESYLNCMTARRSNPCQSHLISLPSGKKPGSVSITMWNMTNIIIPSPTIYIQGMSIYAPMKRRWYLGCQSSQPLCLGSNRGGKNFSRMCIGPFCMSGRLYCSLFQSASVSSGFEAGPCRWVLPQTAGCFGLF